MEDQINEKDKVETPKANANENLNALDLLKSARLLGLKKGDKTPQSYSESSGVACTLGICWEMRPDVQ
jgi:phosphoglycerol transferase MdoB-like AlkP superfamily enzyme